MFFNIPKMIDYLFIQLLTIILEYMKDFLFMGWQCKGNQGEGICECCIFGCVQLFSVSLSVHNQLGYNFPI